MRIAVFPLKKALKFVHCRGGCERIKVSSVMDSRVSCAIGFIPPLNGRAEYGTVFFAELET